MEELLPENSTMVEDLDTQPSCSSGRSSGRATKQRADAELKDTFAKALEECVASVSDLAKVPRKNSTFSLFESFAQKIIDANLSQADVYRIEAKIMLVLHEELAKCYK
ncbi:PREDICTED: uncharacterized protein LOC108374307 [Rhagoletis zephyria]|uniref:uncharacterized protein LOC108374307 n=1 Tax=Rhagoletis zephyria TaxID=28612 RepID=UPI0008112B24|nr:PREDICTED: uncharacterized protein LOC108374307 [Rhagoletis zephyria]